MHDKNGESEYLYKIGRGRQLQQIGDVDIVHLKNFWLEMPEGRKKGKQPTEIISVGCFNLCIKSFILNYRFSLLTRVEHQLSITFSQCSKKQDCQKYYQKPNVLEFHSCTHPKAAVLVAR